MHPAIYTFSAEIGIIGVNPFVFVPDHILKALFIYAGKASGPIPVHGILNGKPYQQTLVRFRGEWRLYINTTMLRNSPQHAGERIEITVAYDPESRAIEPPEKFTKALLENAEAKAVFERLSASRKFEIVRYLSRLKSDDALERNIQKAILYLLGKGRFAGRYGDV
jgi:hypothetical protein